MKMPIEDFEILIVRTIGHLKTPLLGKEDYLFFFFFFWVKGERHRNQEPTLYFLHIVGFMLYTVPSTNGFLGI